MTIESLQNEYRSAWRGFTDEVGELTNKIGQIVTGDAELSLHNLVRDLYDIPYHEAHGILSYPPVDAQPKNVGAVTGLFFEQIVCAALVPYFRKHCPGARIERNRWSDPAVKPPSRDPDLFLTNGDRRVVFEFKASPKKRDMDYVRQQRDKYTAVGIPYFLVGGWVSLSGSELARYAAEPWACFFEASGSNAKHLASCNNLDIIAAAAASHLTVV